MTHGIMTRDEMLFWRMIDTYAEPVSTGPDGGLIYEGYGLTIILRFYEQGYDNEVIEDIDDLNRLITDREDNIGEAMGMHPASHPIGTSSTYYVSSGSHAGLGLAVTEAIAT